MKLSNDPITAIREVWAFLQGLPISTEQEIVKDGVIVGYWLPIEYFDSLLAIRKSLENIEKNSASMCQQEAIKSIVEIIRFRGHERAVIDRDGKLHLLCLNEQHARLMLEPILKALLLAIANNTADAEEVVARNIGITKQEVHAVHRFACQMFAEGEFATIAKKTAKKQKSVQGGKRDD